MRAAVIVMLAAASAQASPERAAEKAGWKDPQLVAKGKVSVVAADGEVLLVDRKSRVIDAGHGAANLGRSTVKVRTFLHRKDLLDVIVHSEIADGMGGQIQDMHYVVRARSFELACTFAGASSSADDAGSQRHTVTLYQTSSHPLGWEVITDGSERTSYTLADRGTCEGGP